MCLPVNDMHTGHVREFNVINWYCKTFNVRIRGMQYEVVIKDMPKTGVGQFTTPFH